jgi:hypothetical protein
MLAAEGFRLVSVHDNLVYAQAVDNDGCRVVLHTVYPHTDPPEYTDIEFVGVVAYHIEQQAFRGGRVSANVVFDAEESDPAPVLGRYTAILAAAKNHGWPVLAYDDPADLAGPGSRRPGPSASRYTAVAACPGSCSPRAWSFADARRGRRS